MARSVTDLLLLDSTITGDTTPAQPAMLKGLRLGVPRAYFYENLDRDVVPVVEAALLKLRDVGCVLVEADIPEIKKLSAISGCLSQYECVTDLSHYLAEEGLSITAQDVIRQIASPTCGNCMKTRSVLKGRRRSGTSTPWPWIDLRSKPRMRRTSAAMR